MTPQRTAPPSRWLLILTLAVVAAFAVLRTIVAARLDLRSDEAYYWTWAGEWTLSYLDHPPIVAWLERLGIALFGDTNFGIRIAQLLAFSGAELLLADIARRRTHSWNAFLFVLLAMECTLNYGFFSIVVEPSVPLLAAVSLLLWAACRLERDRNPRWWLLIGVAAGLALLSKYLVVLLLLPFALGLLPRWWRTPWPYVALAISLALFAPVLVWNARHDWASLAYHLHRLGVGDGSGSLLRFLLYETLWIGPVLMVAVIAGAVILLLRALGRRDPFEGMVATAFLVPFGFFVWRSMDLLVNQSWAWAIWPPGILGLALVLPWGRARKAIAALAVSIAVTGGPLVVAMGWHATLDGSVWLGRGDPLGQDAGFGDFAQAALALAEERDLGWIATTDYRTYAVLQWHVGARIPVVQINERARFLDFAPRNLSDFAGPALYLHRGRVPAVVSVPLAPLDALPVTWRGVRMGSIDAAILAGFPLALAPPPGDPAYRW